MLMAQNTSFKFFQKMLLIRKPEQTFMANPVVLGFPEGLVSLVTTLLLSWKIILFINLIA